MAVSMTIWLPLPKQSEERKSTGGTPTNFSRISPFGKCHSPVAAVGHYQPDHVDDETGMESDGREIDKGEAHFLEERSKYDTIGLELIFTSGGFA
jgi:hypothetical protein